jgi:hypothetical protein
MHFYWRIIEELRYLGERWIINDPSLRRQYDNWCTKHKIERIHLLGLSFSKEIKN